MHHVRQTWQLFESNCTNNKSVKLSLIEYEESNANQVRLKLPLIFIKDCKDPDRRSEDDRYLYESDSVLYS